MCNVQCTIEWFSCIEMLKNRKVPLALPAGRQAEGDVSEADRGSVKTDRVRDSVFPSLRLAALGTSLDEGGLWDF